MKLPFSLLSILIGTIGAAQITITETDFPTAGDTAMVSSSDETLIDLITTGANTIWDFSAINISAQTIDTFHSVQNANVLYQLTFNNNWDNPDHVSDYFTPWLDGALGQLGQFGIGIEYPVQFTAVLSDKVQNTGLGMNINGFNVPAKSDTIDVQYVLPMNYSDSWSGWSYTNLDLNPAFNGIYRRYQQRNSIVDGWGQITTPFDTFEALRVISLVSATDSIYANLGGFGNWFELPTPDQVEYDWFANGEKIPVFSVVTADVGGTETITSIRFKDKKRHFASSQELAFDSKIYPNPVNGQVKLSFSTVPSYIEIYGVGGKLIKEVVPNSIQYLLNTTAWDSGIYILKIHQQNGFSIKKLLVD